VQYAAFAIFMAYAEGYKGFQMKFSPMVVRRAYTLGKEAPAMHKVGNDSVLHTKAVQYQCM
jgi:hypothetical protein